MTGLYSEPIGNVAEQSTGSEAYPASVWDSQELAGTTQQLLRSIGTGQRQFGAIDEWGNRVSEPEPTVDPDTLNQRYQIPGHLRFAAPLPESTAASMYDAKREELARQDAAARSDAGMLTRFGAGLAAGAADPLNIAAAFMPVVGEARVAGALARTGLDTATVLGRSAARMATGTVNGAVGQVPLVALRYGLSRQEQADYSATDALTDVLMGGLLGGGLHTALGGAGDVIGQSFQRGRVASLVEDDPVAREKAARAAIGAVANGDPVNVAPVLDTTALRSAYADRLAARGGTEGGNYAAYTPQGQRIELRPEVAELADLVASHNPDGTVNPTFPHDAGMQPRDRTSAASQAQITELASRLEPERLGPSPEASTGAPIVNESGAVESGNGRVLALHRVYSDPALSAQAQAYRAFLAASGHDVEGMSAPVLIGRRVTQLAPDEARAFVQAANERSTLGMNAAEQARLDAGRAGKAIQAYRPGSLTGRDNQAFVGAFMAQVPAEERAGMVLANGQLSAVGEARIRAALLAHAYGDALGPTLERILNGDVEHMKAVAGALTDEAGAWSQLRTAAARGDIPPGLDITPAIGEAVQLLDNARAKGMTPAAFVAQSSLFTRPSPAAEGLLRLMFRDDAMKRPVARAKLAELLDHYVQQAMEAKTGPTIFLEPETTAADVLRAIAGDDTRTGSVADAFDAQAREDAAQNHGTEPAPVAAESEAAPLIQVEKPHVAQPNVGETPLATAEARAALEQQTARLEQEINAMHSDEAPNPEIRAAMEQLAEESERSGDTLKGIQEASACLAGAFV